MKMNDRYECFTNANQAGHPDQWGWIIDHATEKSVVHWGKSQILKTKKQAEQYTEKLNSCGYVGDYCSSCPYTEICITNIFC